MTKPSFFIVGAPKCGTTAMASYLAEHPDVFISTPKEPLYFLHPSDYHRKIVDENHYLSLFKRASGFGAIGEASIWYLYSDHARKAIHKFNPDAKIIVMTRSPVEFVASLHSQCLFSNYETEPDLAKAWFRERDNMFDGSGETIEQTPAWRRMYAELMLHDKYLARYRKTFGEDNVLVVRHEDMRRDTRNAYVRVLDFLDVDDDGRTEFPKVNANKIQKSKALGRLMLTVNGQDWAIRLARKAKSTFGIGSFGLYQALSNANAKKALRPETPDHVREDIEAKASEFESQKA